MTPTERTKSHLSNIYILLLLAAGAHAWFALSAFERISNSSKMSTFLRRSGSRNTTNTFTAQFQYDSTDERTVGKLWIEHAPKDSIKSFKYLCFSASWPWAILQGGELIEQEGDWHKVKLNTNFANTDYTIHLDFSFDGPIRKGTDYPRGLFLETANAKRVPVQLRRPVDYILQSQEPLEGQTPQFIPMPQQVIIRDVMDCPETISFGPGLWNIDWLQRLLERLTSKIAIKSSQGWPITSQWNEKLEHAFYLSMTDRGADLQYSNKVGFSQGQAYLFQYLLQASVLGRLHTCDIAGSPKYSYRGVHLDVVRHFFSIDQISQWWDVMALFQFNRFHWHLTDDEGWRLESEQFPELNTVGSWRGPDEKQPPLLGSGIEKYGGFYTKDEVREFVEHLNTMGVTVLPELDLPGHARALMQSLPQLNEDDDTSVYHSVQHFHKNVINPAYASTEDVVASLVEEWMELFPAPLFHVGSDEVPHGVWQNSTSAKAWADEHQKPISALQGDLLSKIEQQLKANGKTMAGWEEVRQKGVSTDTWVFAWQGVESGIEAAKSGHPVVLTPAQYAYFDLAVTTKSEDPGLYWAGTVDLRKAYHYQPTKGYAALDESKIEGVQFCLWTELLDSSDKAAFMLFPRLLAGAQVAWGGNSEESYESFLSAAEHWSQLLIRLGVAVRSQTQHW